ncbi:MAG: tetratricopeptide repeat protein [Planctomycetes bacterium]|nr:tetratricopeptide repeat protein [Planctomycetota bacterium]
MSDYDKAIELDPKDEKTFHNRGFAKYTLGDYTEAIYDYNKAIELNPNYSKAFCNRGSAKDATGDSKGALSDYTKAIELDPSLKSTLQPKIDKLTLSDLNKPTEEPKPSHKSISKSIFDELKMPGK